MPDEIKAMSHPWHGVDPAIDRDRLTVFVESTPKDDLRYELDPASGLLRGEQPSPTSARPPYAYGFVPRSCCGTRVAALTNDAEGDGSALDVFIIGDQPITRSNALLTVRVVAGIPVSDRDKADDKLVVLVSGNHVHAAIDDVDDIPAAALDRIVHYLEHYSESDYVHVGAPYGRMLARQMLDAALEDYRERFGD